MRKNSKIIIISAFLILIVISGFIIFGSGIFSNEGELFNQTIKNASNIENESDRYFDKEINASFIKASNYSKVLSHEANNSMIETEMLKNLSAHTTNETLKEYIDLQADRTYLETKSWEERINWCDAIIDYEKGNGSKSQIEACDKTATDYDDQVNDKKIESEKYLNNHPDLKQRLEELNLDEDFLVYQLETNDFTVKP